MTDKKLTDNEIKKALECCKNDGIICYECPYKKTNGCMEKLSGDALDYINRLETENERLEKECEELAYKLGCLLCTATGGKLSKHTYPLEVMESYVNDTIQDYCEEAEAEAKAEAYKEFAERLKEREQWDVEYRNKIIFTSDIDNLLKEMESEEDA